MTREAELLRLYEAGTKGPFVVHRGTMENRLGYTAGAYRKNGHNVIADYFTWEDAVADVALRNALPALCKVVAAAREECSRRHYQCDCAICAALSALDAGEGER